MTNTRTYIGTGSIISMTIGVGGGAGCDPVGSTESLKAWYQVLGSDAPPWSNQVKGQCH